MARYSRAEEAENPFWITYSDLLSSMVLLLLVLLVVFIKISDAQRQQLLEKTKKLQQTVDENKKLLAEAPRLQKKSARLLKLKQELKDLKSILLRERKLRIELQDNGLTVSVDQRLLFDGDDVELKDEGKVFLRKFIPILANTITKGDYTELITGIVFEGRADPSFVKENWNEAYLHNLRVTLERSQNVVKYVFDSSFKAYFTRDSHDWYSKSRERLRYLVLASGRSSVDRVKQEIPDPDNLQKDWKNKKLWQRKDPKSRQVLIRLELYNPLPDLEFGEQSSK